MDKKRSAGLILRGFVNPKNQSALPVKFASTNVDWLIIESIQIVAEII